MPQDYDCIVLGVGGVGSAALYYAARRGWRTLGLDRFSPGHARGSSHGQTRIIRQAYFEHPDYVPLVLDACRLWDEVEKRAGVSLFQQTGLLQVGCPDGTVIQGVRRCADRHDLPLRSYTTTELRQAFPLFNCRDGDVGLFEEVAGFLRVEACVETFASLARSCSAEILDGVAVGGWERTRTGCEVHTDRGTFSARRLIVTAGAWAGGLLPRLAVPLQVIAKHQHWFRLQDRRATRQGGCPTFFFETDQGYFYGFPALDERGNKIAEHSGGKPVPDPLEPDREPDPADLQRVQDFCHGYLNAPRGVPSDHSVCLYTMSPDEHFVVDGYDGCQNVAFACGMSGHGFKFCPVIGQALVEMVEGRRRDDMDFLRATRFNDGVG